MEARGCCNKAGWIVAWISRGAVEGVKRDRILGRFEKLSQ